MEFEIYFKSKSQGESRSSVCLETDKTYQGGPPKRVEKGSKEGTGRPFPLAHHRSRSPDHRVAGHWTTTVTTIFFTLIREYQTTNWATLRLRRGDLFISSADREVGSVRNSHFRTCYFQLQF